MTMHKPISYRLPPAAFDATSDDRQWFGFALAAAACAHVLLAFSAPKLSGGLSSPRPERPTEMVDIDVPQPEPPPPPPPEPPPKNEEPPPPPPASKAPAPSRAEEKSEPPPPAAAQAGAVLTAEKDPNEPVDLTDGFVTGTASSYAGGSTQASGTSTTAVHGRPSPNGTPGGTGSAPPRVAPPPEGPDRSRPPTLAGSASWNCPFPGEADEQQIDHAVVTLKVSVDAGGRVASVSIANDPGNGFGREARRCAMVRSWTAALDHSGSPVPGTTLVNVRFDR